MTGRLAPSLAMTPRRIAPSAVRPRMVGIIAVPRTRASAAAPSVRRVSRVARDARVRAGASGVAPAPTGCDTLASLPFASIISADGHVFVEQSEGTQASVFAIFDQAKQLQFVGFSKDLRNSLRTVLARQTELCFFFKHVDLDEVDQDAMLAVRAAWFDENGGAPPGNAANKQALWQRPIDAGGLSERGKQVAAKQRAEATLKKLQQRGVREPFIPDESLLSQGLVDFLPAAELSAEERRAKEVAREQALAATETQ